MGLPLLSGSSDATLNLRYPVVMATGWQRQIHWLRFDMGGLPAARVRLPALVLETHFSRLPGDPAQSGPPLDELGPGLEVIVMPSHPVSSQPGRFARMPRCYRYAPRVYRRHYITIEGSFDDYLARFSAKSRATLRRKVKRFTAAPGATLREYRAPEQMDDFFRLARAVSCKTYQEALYGKGLPDDDAFRSEMHALAAEDRVRAYVLFHQDQPVAYLYCPAQDGVLLYEHLGYDPAAAALSPGTVLQQLALERLFAERRFRMFDFTEGEGAHKEQFASASVLCADLLYFRLTARNLALIGLHAGAALASRRTAALLQRTGVAGRVRRFVRRRGVGGVAPPAAEAA